ncbi:OprO/OprP family phosphate-selective porin [Ferribacterium limneticum]|uniref:OprO/OprP family phosphate-selective porin n=1 Tax=Ferribacterium limneticum TaxID=76259 RepID=UPI001CFA2B30|nr:OprO/OprP family phosphate-selective porin [Ferribacterium limneticum]UCV19213.1 carbohydrate porin [Ferribacterium limneticum]
MQKSFAMAALMAASCGAQAASDADLAAIRAQIDDIKKTYEQRIAALEQKLVQAESRATSQAKPAAPEVDSRPVAPAATGASGFNPEVSLILQGQYKSMKDVAERGITGFVPAGGHDHGAGAIEGINKRGFSVEHTELVLAANIDPYWRGQAILALADGEVEVEEAWFQSLAIGHGVGLKGGRMRSGIGYLNEQHPHMWDFADAPLMYRAMFGDHASYAQDGLQFKWLAPTPVFLEFGAEVGRGANFPGTDRNKNGAGAGAIFAHIGGDVGVSNDWRAGVSYLKTKASARGAHFAGTVDDEVEGLFSGNSSTWLADFVWKWAPNGNPKYQNFKFQTEYFSRQENGDLTCATPEDASATVSCDGQVSAYKTRQSGWYAQGVYQFTPQWRAGLRYEQLDSGTRDFGANAANLVVDSYRPKKASVMVDYSWSEFSRVRLQLAQDKSMLGITDNQLTLQYVMSLGAHGAHKF